MAILGLHAMAFTLLGCAHETVDESEEKRPSKLEYEHVSPMVGGEYVAPFYILYELGKASAGRSAAMIWGQCLVVERDDSGIQVSEPYPCPETFVEVKRGAEDSGFKAWIEPNGRFEIPFRQGDTYRVKAVCECFSLTSAEIVLNGPGKIALTIYRKKRNLNH